MMPGFVAEYGLLILRGLWITVQVTLLAAPLTMIVAFVAGLGRASRFRPIRSAATALIEFFRGTSIFVQLFWAYFVLPLVGLPLTPMQAGVLVLALNVGSYGAEIVRGAIAAVPRGQHEAAVALNLTRWQRFRYVVLPQAFVLMLPGFGNSAVELLKGTSIVSLISLQDMTFNAEMIRAQTGSTALPFLTILVLYYVLSAGVVAGCRWLERRMSAGLDVTRV